MSNTAELYAGLPQGPARPSSGATEEQRAAFQKAMKESVKHRENGGPQCQ